MRLAIAAMGIALAAPVAAEDTSADFRDAYVRTYGERAPEALSAAEVGLGVLASVAGTWLQADFAMEGPDLDPEMLAGGCGFRPIAITNVGNFGFQTEPLVRGEPSGNVRTYMFTMGRYYSFVTDLNGLAARLYRDRDLSIMDLQELAPVILSAANSGYARVELMGPDVLMMDSPTSGAMILVRCPAG